MREGEIKLGREWEGMREREMCCMWDGKRERNVLYIQECTLCQHAKFNFILKCTMAIYKHCILWFMFILTGQTTGETKVL